MDAYSACVLTYRSSSESWPGQPEAECGVVPWRARCWDQQASRCQTQTERTVLMTEKRSPYFNQRKECETLTLFPLPEEASAWPSTPYKKKKRNGGGEAKVQFPVWGRKKNLFRWHSLSLTLEFLQVPSSLKRPLTGRTCTAFRAPNGYPVFKNPRDKTS